jgi:hypothetical protein
MEACKGARFLKPAVMGISMTDSGKVRAFSYFGAELKNNRTSWSAITKDKSAVVISVWTEDINWKLAPITCSVYGDERLQRWKGLNGNKERLIHLNYAVKRCDGIFRVVVGYAESYDARLDGKATYKEHKNLIMRVRHEDIDQLTGEYRATSING